jgi:hypothetical protein
MSALPALLLAAAITGTLDLGDRSEMRARDSNEPIGPTIDIETTPAIAIRLRARSLTLDLGYGPRLTLRQLDHGPLPEVLHHGLFALGIRLRHGELALRSDASYGTQSFTSLATTTPTSTGTPPITQLPPATAIDYVAARNSLILRYAPDPRWSFTARVEHALAGGVDAAARATMPFQQGPLASIEAEIAATRLDRVLTSFSFTRSTFTPGPDDTLFDAQVGWRHRLDRRTEATLAAGAAGLVWRKDGVAATTRGFPIAEVGLSQRFPPQRIETRYALRLAPIVSWLNGAVDERAQADASFVWTARQGMTVRAQLGVAQSVPLSEDAALTLVMGEAAFAVPATRFVRFEVGTRAAWQYQRGSAVPPPQWVMFVGATFAAPTLRF